MRTIRTNSKAMRELLLKMPVKEAAQISGVSRQILYDSFRHDRPINYSTAGKLRAAFGDDVIIFDDLKGGGSND